MVRRIANASSTWSSHSRSTDWPAAGFEAPGVVAQLQSGQYARDALDDGGGSYRHFSSHRLNDVGRPDTCEDACVTVGFPILPLSGEKPADDHHGSLERFGGQSFLMKDSNAAPHIFGKWCRGRSRIGQIINGKISVCCIAAILHTIKSTINFRSVLGSIPPLADQDAKLRWSVSFPRSSCQFSS